MGVAAGGFAVMAGAPSRPGLAGMTFSFIAMIAYAATIVVARSKAEVSMAPATCLSQVLVFVVFAPFAHFGEIGGANLGYLALMGVVQMGLALFFLSMGARLIPSVEVALIAQLENVLAPLWVWLAGLEHPSGATIAGGIVVIGAVVLQVTQGIGSRDRTRRPAAQPAGSAFGGSDRLSPSRARAIVPAPLGGARRQGGIPLISISSEKLRKVLISTISPRVRAFSSVGSMATVRTRSAATKISRPSSKVPPRSWRVSA
jgi:hypothetical protein